MSVVDRYAVMGHPIAHSRSPEIHAMFAAQTGQSLRYDRLDVPPEDFTAAVTQFFAGGGRGLNITLPHKVRAFELAVQRSARATSAGTVNTLWLDNGGQLCGDNTDGVGLVRDLTHNLGLSLSGRRILLLGAGGASRGVLGALLEHAPAVVTILNRTHARAETLAADFAAAGPVRAATTAALAREAPYDLCINGTAASLSNDIPELPRSAIVSATFCYDMAYGPGGTAFTRWAGSLGAARSAMGLGMLVEQAAEAFFIWRRVRPDTAPVLRALSP